MNLFHKEKDLIHRIANLILILWIVIAIFVAYSSLVNLIVKKEMLTYKEYEKQYCINGVITDKANPEDSEIAYTGNCKSSYERYKVSFDDNDFYARRTLINSLGNIVIVGVAVFLLNRKKD